jgi:1-acyl-sn-glycerol-3-phosphate acyltransferase
MPKRKDWFYACIKAVLYTVYRVLFRFRSYDVQNVPHHETRGIIFAPNHASYLDPPVIGISTKDPITYLAKEYLFKPPVFGSALRWLGVLPIKSEKDDFKSMRNLIRLLQGGARTVVFAEGTRSPDGELQKVEPGIGFLALKSNAVIVPTYIKGSFEAYPRGVKWPRWFKPVRVYYGKPFVPSEYESIAKSENPYAETAQKILREIKILKEKHQ